jgi:hypothetical protein
MQKVKADDGVKRRRRDAAAYRPGFGIGRAGALAPLLAGALLAGCALGGDNLLLLADSGKYRYHTCEQISNAAKGAAVRRQELATLIERAEQSPGGVVVGALAYRVDITAVEQDLRVLETTARDKNCANPANWRSNSVIQ